MQLIQKIISSEDNDLNNIISVYISFVNKMKFYVFFTEPCTLFLQ